MTSLAEQLKKLAIPRSLQQRDTKRKATLLFDDLEAGSIDRDAIYEIGVDGLKELTRKDSVFAQFSDNLFDLNSRLFDRTIQSKEANKKLDQTIEKFLQLLSPYVLLKSTHKALEWLIRRYHIHEFNTNDLMSLVLPYHESKIFAKVLQLIPLGLQTSKNFIWLDSIKKQGVILPKLTLINHLISDSSFLRFICENFIKTVKEHKNSKGVNKLGTLINFYCLTMVNTLKRNEVTDHHITIIIPSLMSALSEESNNIKAAAYMICGQLVASHQVSRVLLEEILKQVVNDIGENTGHLRKEQALLLVLIFQKQNSAKFPSTCDIQKLIILKEALKKLSEDGIHIEPLLENFRKIGLEAEYPSEEANTPNESVLDITIDMQYFQELKECQGDEKETAWLKLRPRLIGKINNNEIFKALCKVAPSYDKLVLMLCLDKILKKHTKERQAAVVKSILKSNYGKTNLYIQEINNRLHDDESIVHTLETFVLKQNSEFDNPVEFEPWLAAMKELRNFTQFADNPQLLELGLRILVASLPSEFNATHALQILQYLRTIKKPRTKVSIKILRSLLAYMKCKRSDEGQWYDLSSKKPEIWLKIRIWEYLSEEAHKEPKYKVLWNEFSKLAFPNKEDFISFICSVCSGTPFETLPSEYIISPLLQIYSLNAAWLQFKKDDPLVARELFPELDRALCHMLICLSSPCAPVRQATLKVIEALVPLMKQHKAKNVIFYEQLLMRSLELLADHEQISIAMYYLLSPSKSVQSTLNPKILSVMTETRDSLFSIATADDTPLCISAKLLSILEAVTSNEIIMNLTGLCSRALTLSKELSIARVVISNFWTRLNEETADLLESSEVWELAVKCLKHTKCDMNPAVSFLKCISKEVFEKLTDSKKYEILELLISVRSETDCNDVSSAIAAAIKRINVDSEIILPLIKKMTSISSVLQKQRTDGRPPSASHIIEARDWKTGVSLLELIQSKKKLQNSNLLLQPLFDLLQFCFTQEEQTSFEYAKQLVLGCLLHCCQKLSASSTKVDGSSLNADLVVQCLRASPNPQTHHHALLLLSCLAALVPDQVMHNIMAIFTFMGTSVTRLDDEHSVKIVTQVVDAIVPVLMKSMSTETQTIQKVMAKILVVFVWALKDIPQHRRKPLFFQLLTTLQPDQSLWILLLLLIEHYVLQGNPDKTEGLPENLLLGLQLTLSMIPQVILQTILKLVRYLNSLPTEIFSKDLSPGRFMHKKFSKKSDNLFDTEIKTSKQLRHFTYMILTFLNNLLSNNSFVVQVTEENKDEKALEPAFKETIALLMGFIRTALHEYEVEHDKFWKAVIHQCYEMLDKFISLVPSEMLLNVIKQLLEPSMGYLRKKSLDLFNVLLQNRREDLTKSEKESLVHLLEPILEIILEIGESTEQEKEILQQTALISLKLLTKLLSSENLKLFKEILAQLCEIAKKKKCEGYLLGSVMVAISDQVTCLKVHSVSQLPIFLPLMLKMFSSNVRHKVTDLGLISVTTALYRVVDILPHFLSPYLDQVLYNVCLASVIAPENSDLNKKLVQIRQNIANNVESRVLIPSVAACYEKLIEKRKFDAIGPLLVTLSANFSASADVVKLVADLSKFFFNALNFRSNAESTSLDVTLTDIEKVEGFVIEALVQLVLKLSESSFRPLYYQLCHWASEHPDRNISFFRLSCRLAEGLKGLFVLFAGHFLQNAANLLDAVNLSKTETCYFDDRENGEAKSILLLENILKTLHLVFLYDSADTNNFLNKDKFEVLLHPLVDQLDNPLGGMDVLEVRRKNLLTPCLAQMALATDDTLWKTLNYQILVKTKSSLPQVRIGALETIVAMATKLGEDYLSLLPETIGSLAELLEDDDERVENAMKKAIQQLEEALGQPIREYFQS